MSDPLLPDDLWEAARQPEGFTAADGVALMALESGMALEPWQFDVIARHFNERGAR